MTWPTTVALSQPAGRRLPALAIVIVAILLGVVLGVFARIWMRLIAPDPEFTTAGTIGILTGFGLLFAGAGLSLAAHRNGWRRVPLGVARTIGCVLILPAFGGLVCWHSRPCCLAHSQSRGGICESRCASSSRVSRSP